MTDQNEPRERRRPRDKKPAEDESPVPDPRRPEPIPTPPPPESSPPPGRLPEVDREAIAAREAGIYDRAGDDPAPGPQPSREGRRPRPRRRRRSSSRRSPPPPPPEEPADDDEATIDWLQEIEDEMAEARGGAAPAPEPEPRPEEAPPPGTASKLPEPGPGPEEEPRRPAEGPGPEPREEDGFAAGIFDEEKPAAPEPEPAPAETGTEPSGPPEPAEEPVSEKPAAVEEPPVSAPGPEDLGSKGEEEGRPLPAVRPGVARRWLHKTWAEAVERRPERKEDFRTPSDLPLAPLYGPSIRAAKAFDDHVGYPAEYPFTRGVHATMYRGRLWTMRQYAGFASARATNERFRYLLSQGQTGLSVAFDLPTQIGYDSDDERALGEVGKVGVPVNSLKDMEVLLTGIPLDKVSLSMTVNSTALIQLLMVVAVAKRQGVPPEKLRGTVQNDMLKEFVARNTNRFPLDAHLRLVTDLFRYSQEHLPRFNLISVSGYHMREAGCTAVQEVAFTLANAIAYVRMAVDAGLDVDEFAARLSFFFAAHNHLFEEVAKFRAARRLWAKIMRERFGAKTERAMMLRFHTQTAGSTLTAKQPDANIVRVTLQALAAVLGGTQSLHTNSYDEALGLPTRESALLALRTQQVIACESGVTDVVDPLGGDPLVEDLTDGIEKAARRLIDRIDGMGGAVEAVRNGFMRGEIEAAAYRAQQAIESGERAVVGVNIHETDEAPEAALPPVDQAQVDEVLASLASLKEERNSRRAEAALAALEISTAWGDADLPELILECVESYCTVGEICRTLESVLAREENG